MRALIVYESMFGNTRKIAEAIGDGLRLHGSEVVIRGVCDVVPGELLNIDLVVVGGPTHVHSLSRPATRRTARDRASQGDNGLQLDPSASETMGVREWLESVRLTGLNAAAFDTRVHAPAVFTGRASKGIARRLARAHARVIAGPMSFLVTKYDELVGGELDRAKGFGVMLGDRMEARHVA